MRLRPDAPPAAHGASRGAGSEPRRVRRGLDCAPVVRSSPVRSWRPCCRALSVALVTQLWNQPLHVPFQYAHTPGDDEQDATLDMMLIKNVHETGWFNTNPKLERAVRAALGRVADGRRPSRLHDEEGASSRRPATCRSRSTSSGCSRSRSPRSSRFPALRSLRCSWATALVGAVLFSLAPYHFRNGVGHENLAFYVGVPVIVLLCMKILGPDARVAVGRRAAAPRRVVPHALAAPRRRARSASPGIYYLAFLLSLLVDLRGRERARAPPAGPLRARRRSSARSGSRRRSLANLPTLLYRWQHAANLLGVPDRRRRRLRGLPAPARRAAQPRDRPPIRPVRQRSQTSSTSRARMGSATADARTARRDRLRVSRSWPCSCAPCAARSDRGWSFEARLGIVMLGATLPRDEGRVRAGRSSPRASHGVRAWTRIAIVVAFASHRRVRLVSSTGSGSSSAAAGWPASRPGTSCSRLCSSSACSTRRRPR